MDLQDLSEGKLQSSKAGVLQAVEHQRSECTWLKTIAGTVDHQRSETIVGAVDHQRSVCTWLKTIVEAVDHQRSHCTWLKTMVREALAVDRWRLTTNGYVSGCNSLWVVFWRRLNAFDGAVTWLATLDGTGCIFLFFFEFLLAVFFAAFNISPEVHSLI